MNVTKLELEKMNKTEIISEKEIRLRDHNLLKLLNYIYIHKSERVGKEELDDFMGYDVGDNLKWFKKHGYLVKKQHLGTYYYDLTPKFFEWLTNEDYDF